LSDYRKYLLSLVAETTRLWREGRGFRGDYLPAKAGVNIIVSYHPSPYPSPSRGEG